MWLFVYETHGSEKLGDEKYDIKLTHEQNTAWNERCRNS